MKIDNSIIIAYGMTGVIAFGIAGIATKNNEMAFGALGILGGYLGNEIKNAIVNKDSTPAAPGSTIDDAGTLKDQ